MRRGAVIAGGVLLLALAVAAWVADAPRSLRADQGSTRWGEAPPVSGDSPRYGEGEAPSKEPGKPRLGARKLKIGQEVLAAGCEAYPLSCLCPPDSVKVTYFESEGWNTKSVKKATCLAAACEPGKVMRKRVDVSKGSVAFVCEKVPTQ